MGASRLLRALMKYRLAIIAVAAFCHVSGSAVAAPATYELDPEHVSVGFLVDHVGYAKVLGMFRKVTGRIVFDEDTGAIGSVAIEIDTQSVFSNHRKRDDHLRGADFLNASEFPVMKFAATGGVAAGNRRYTLNGSLTLIGQTRPVTLEATWNKSGEYPFSSGVFGGKPWVLGISARGQFKRSDFGMNYSVSNGWIGDTVELIIELEAQRQQ
ncbi:MAG: YceI family protein [Gammaproteobacteria bacterium]|nr:YceI family protein [Gammaproteobacteria bacterium]